ncbi:hypothetical protein EV702DRAFT_1276409 [Suillus placidus]|uniref:Uncharacterized protein n=1 Tax=Suillus placidus TaxID=48579 RepID=A0A9P7D521_9AGAM|nr:hypothetical protein EV702DRAFT_1276409 [Suillus placidus]
MGYGWVYTLAYSPSDESVASGGEQYNSRHPTTSHVFSMAKQANCSIAYLKQHDLLYSVALSPKHNILACVGNGGVVQLWDTESYQPLGQPFYQKREIRSICIGGDDKQLTPQMVKHIAPQLPAPKDITELPAPTLLQKGDRRSTQQETRPNSPSSYLDVDATGGAGFIEEPHIDPYRNFFQQSLLSPSPSPGFHLPPCFRLAASRMSSLDVAHRQTSLFHKNTPSPHQPVPEGKVREGEGEGEQGENIDDYDPVHDSLSARKDKGKQRDDPPADAQSPPSYDRTPSVHLDSRNNRKFWERLMQARIKKTHIWFPVSQHSTCKCTPTQNAAQSLALEF